MATTPASQLNRTNFYPQDQYFPALEKELEGAGTSVTQKTERQLTALAPLQNLPSSQLLRTSEPKNLEEHLMERVARMREARMGQQVASNAIPRQKSSRETLPTTQLQQAPQTAIRGESASKKRKELHFKVPLTPQSYKAAQAAKVKMIKSDYEDSESSCDSYESLLEASDCIGNKQYKKAVIALRQSYSFIQTQQFIYFLLDSLGIALDTKDPRICTPRPEEDLDVLILRGIYKIKHGKFESAKNVLQQVLSCNENEKLAQLLFEHACELINRSKEETSVKVEKAPR